MILPFDAEWTRAKNRLHDEAVVFVHHFGGDKRATLRHARMMNELGYDCVRFSLFGNVLTDRRLGLTALPIAADLRWGIRGVWADQIEGVLNAIPQTKIVYSFSMPSACAIEAIGRRRARDVSALICDGGPFLDLYRCVRNLYELEYGVGPRPVLELATATSLLFWGAGFARSLADSFSRLPTEFPILSFRGTNDPLVAESAIDKAFALSRGRPPVAFRIAGGRHLDGLKTRPQEYGQAVSRFLKDVSDRMQ